MRSTWRRKRIGRLKCKWRKMQTEVQADSCKRWRRETQGPCSTARLHWLPVSTAAPGPWHPDLLVPEEAQYRLYNEHSASWRIKPREKKIFHNIFLYKYPKEFLGIFSGRKKNLYLLLSGIQSQGFNKSWWVNISPITVLQQGKQVLEVLTDRLRFIIY